MVFRSADFYMPDCQVRHQKGILCRSSTSWGADRPAVICLGPLSLPRLDMAHEVVDYLRGMNLNDRKG